MDEVDGMDDIFNLDDFENIFVSNNHLDPPKTPSITVVTVPDSKVPAITPSSTAAQPAVENVQQFQSNFTLNQKIIFLNK
jgi:hypothetical protein